MHVCQPPMLLIISGIVWGDIDPIMIGYTSSTILYGNCSCYWYIVGVALKLKYIIEINLIRKLSLVVSCYFHFNSHILNSCTKATRRNALISCKHGWDVRGHSTLITCLKIQLG